MPKSVVYQGPIDAVEIAVTGQVARVGIPLEVDDDIAESLLAQGWKLADKPKTAKDGE
jgi:hypothetical protein